MAPQRSPSPEVPPELANTYWGQLISGPPSTVVKNPRTGGEYKGGQLAPTPGTLSHAQQRALFSSGGTAVTEEDGQKLQAMGWTYGQPAPEGYHYSEHGILEKDVSGWKRAGQIAGIALPIVATVATAGAASPWLAAAVGGAAAMGGAKLQGASWKQALIAGGLGAAGAGVGAANIGTGARIATQAGIGAAGGALQGGGARGALLGAAGAGAGAAAPAVAQAITPQTASAAQRAMTQAGVNAAVGGAFGGRQGALTAAGSTLLNNTMTARARAAQQRRQAYLQQQRSA
jgi:hypothetical protein